MPSALPTGGRFTSAKPRGGQRPCRIPRVRARSEGAILGDAAATPKMAGLAHEVRYSVVFLLGTGGEGGGQEVGEFMHVCVCVCDCVV